MTLKLKMVAALVVGLVGTAAHARTEIVWWHSMSSQLGKWVEDLATEFNSSQSDYTVVPVYKGEYAESLTAGIAAFRAGKAPNILQVFEVGTATMMAAKGAVVPVQKVMSDAGVSFDPDAYIPAVAGYYKDAKGQMLSFPFNSSTAVFYYNKDAFKAAGLDPEKPPATWEDVEAAARKLKDSGARCPLTTTWVGWIQMENFSAWHGVYYASEKNGFLGTKARLEVNSPLFVKHFEFLQRMNKDGLFKYSGRASKGESAFSSGECAMTTMSSSSYAGAKRDSKFNWGMAPLPYHASVKGAPRNTIIGGASLWVMGGKSADEYKGVAKFLSYLSDTKVQAASHQRTGYLPVTLAAYELTRASGFYEKNPGTEVPVAQMVRKAQFDTLGVRLGNFPQIRTIADEETENIWSGKSTPKEALDAVVRRGNEQLERFEKMTTR